MNDNSINARTYESVAEGADKNPGNWIAFRRGVTSANLVTSVKHGRIDCLSPKLYEATSTSYLSGTKRLYDIDIRRISTDDFTLRSQAEQIVAEILPGIESLLVSKVEQALKRYQSE